MEFLQKWRDQRDVIDREADERVRLLRLVVFRDVVGAVVVVGLLAWAVVTALDLRPGWIIFACMGAFFFAQPVFSRWRGMRESRELARAQAFQLAPVLPVVAFLVYGVGDYLRNHSLSSMVLAVLGVLPLALMLLERARERFLPWLWVLCAAVVAAVSYSYFDSLLAVVAVLATLLVAGVVPQFMYFRRLRLDALAEESDVS